MASWSSAEAYRPSTDKTTPALLAQDTGKDKKKKEQKKQDIRDSTVEGSGYSLNS